MTARSANSPPIGPLIGSPTTSFAPGLRHIEPIIYGDVFDYPLTFEEIWRYSPLDLSREELARRLEDNGPDSLARELVGCRDGFYHLKGREELVDLRRERERTSRSIWERARRVAGLISNVPYLRSMAITGSLATDNAGQDGDPDFLVITAPRRIWTVFFFLGTIQKLTSTNTLCPNFYISEDNLKIMPEDYYNAREVAQAIPLVGAGLFDRFLEANHWVADLVPNHRRVARRREPPLPGHGLLRLLGRTFELLTAGFVGDTLERLMQRLLFHRLQHHYQVFGGAAPADVLQAASQGRELRFHGLHHRTLIQNAIAERVDRLQQQLSSRRRTG
jgi:hypothetical protein